MRTSTILIASLLAVASPAGAQLAYARSANGYETGVSVTAAPPAVDTGSEAYPSSATGAGERQNAVIAGGPLVTLSNGEGMPESVNSFPPGFTDPYLAHHQRSRR